MSITVNKVGAFLTVAAFTVVIVLGVRYREAESTSESAPVSTVVPAEPTQVLESPPSVIVPRPVVKRAQSPRLAPPPPQPQPPPVVSLPCGRGLMTTPCSAVQPIRKNRCRDVPKITNEFDRKQVLAAAEQYGLSSEQLSALRACLN